MTYKIKLVSINKDKTIVIHFKNGKKNVLKKYYYLVYYGTK